MEAWRLSTGEHDDDDDDDDLRFIYFINIFMQILKS